MPEMLIKWRFFAEFTTCIPSFLVLTDLNLSLNLSLVMKTARYGIPYLAANKCEISQVQWLTSLPVASRNLGECPLLRAFRH